MSEQPFSNPKAWGGRQYYGEQDDNGIDLSLIRSNLKLTPTERIRRAERAAADIMRVNAIGRCWIDEQIRARRSPSPGLRR